MNDSDKKIDPQNVDSSSAVTQSVPSGEKDTSMSAKNDPPGKNNPLEKNDPPGKNDPPRKNDPLGHGSPSPSPSLALGKEGDSSAKAGDTGAKTSGSTLKVPVSEKTRQRMLASPPKEKEAGQDDVQGAGKVEKLGEDKTRKKGDNESRPRRGGGGGSGSGPRRGREDGRGPRGGGGGGGDRDRRDRGSEDEYIDRLVSINRVAKVVKGGRRFGFSALIVVGDGAGKVGCASGKAREISEAIRKATEKAKRQMIKVPLREGRTLHHDVSGRHGAGKVIMRSAPTGTGIIAGGPMRAIFEALGVQDVVAKSIGSSNPNNMIRATFDAFSRMLSPRLVANKRSRNVRDVIKDRI